MITTAGLAALGAATVAPGLAQEAGVAQTKPWAIGGTIRGFYDDNYYVYPGTTAFPRKDTFGFEVSPAASYNLKREQTDLGLSYQYGFRYYIERPHPKDDQSHQVNARISHPFSDRYSVDASDSFVVAQEPAILEPGALLGQTTSRRSEGNNLRNQGRIGFNAGIMEHLNLQLGYNNTLYDYEENAKQVPVASHSAVLDRIEHLITADAFYEVLPKTQVGISYQYQIMDFTSNDPFVPGVPGTARDNTSHFISGGIKQNLNDTIQLAAKVGVQFTMYDNPLWSDQTSPYADASVRWAYMQGGALQLGVRHSRIATDVTIIGPDLASDAEATSVYASINHALTAKINLQVMGQFQHSDFNLSGGGGTFSDNMVYAGVNLAYQITTNIAAEIGYSYDRLDSDVPLRSFYRDRVFVGARLSF